nr:hypothetical protein KBIHDJOI_00095 [Spodoptera littoralis nucleopolyhedrovirus]WOC30932.1 hypothetical protein GACBDANE_00061 [Spodoptera litura nucleopolyhedrovirus]
MMMKMKTTSPVTMTKIANMIESSKSVQRTSDLVLIKEKNP